MPCARVMSDILRQHQKNGERQPWLLYSLLLCLLLLRPTKKTRIWKALKMIMYAWVTGPCQGVRRSHLVFLFRKWQRKGAWKLCFAAEGLPSSEGSLQQQRWRPALKATDECLTNGPILGPSWSSNAHNGVFYCHKYRGNPDCGPTLIKIIKNEGCWRWSRENIELYLSQTWSRNIGGGWLYHHNAEMCPSLEQNPINHRFANLPLKSGPLSKAYFKNWV